MRTIRIVACAIVLTTTSCLAAWADDVPVPPAKPIEQQTGPAQPAPCCTIHVTPDQLNTIGVGLGKLPYEIAQPVIDGLRAQYLARSGQPRS